MAVKGSCVCGEWTYEYEGEPAAVAVCFCIPCKKTAGSNGSFNLMIPDDKFKKLSGDDFKYTRTGDSGKAVNYRNCGKCATVMVANADSMSGITILKGGTVDSPGEDTKHKPVVEIFRKNAAPWCTPFAGTEQKQSA